MGALVTTTPSTDAVEWTAAMREGAERVAEAVDCQTEVFGVFIEEKCRLKMAVERLLLSSASSSRGVSSVSDVEGSTTGDKDEGMEEDEEMGEANNRVSMRRADDGSSDTEKSEDEGDSDAKGDEEQGDDEGSGENEGERMTRREAESKRAWRPRHPRLPGWHGGPASHVPEHGCGKEKEKEKCNANVR